MNFARLTHDLFVMVDFIPLGQPNLTSKSVLNEVPLSQISQGVSQNDSFIFYRNGDCINCYSRRCDHNRGRLTLFDDKAICPLHGWQFDPTTGNYDDVHVVKKKEHSYIKPDSQTLLIEQQVSNIKFPVKSPQDSRLTVSFLEHACLLFSSKEFKFALDPWVIGPSFVSGWWTTHPPVRGWIDQLNSCDFIYISHNHPDHLNPTTLSFVRKDMPLIVPDFSSKSAETSLMNLGFNNIIPLTCGNVYELGGTSLVLSVLKSGDFRDDSGIYFNYGDFSFLSTVDSNDLNSGILPPSPTILASSFAGGASGFPLCFDVYDENKKSKILKRNKNAAYRVQVDLVNMISPSFYLPYAGFFKERSAMDDYILKNNMKNTVKDYSGAVDCNLIDIDENDEFTFDGDSLVASGKLPREDKLDDPEEWIALNLDTLPDLTEHQIVGYFERSQFKDDLTICLLPCDNDFNVQGSCFLCDFSGDKPSVRVLENLPEWDAFANSFVATDRLLLVRVRSKAFAYVLYNGLPWEDLSIGFQCRINRIPDVYNSKFWNHFTNVYIGNASKVSA